MGYCVGSQNSFAHRHCRV